LYCEVCNAAVRNIECRCRRGSEKELTDGRDAYPRHGGMAVFPPDHRQSVNRDALEVINAQRETPIRIRQSKYLNNLVIQAAFPISLSLTL
jgi:hypothetical protein